MTLSYAFSPRPAARPLLRSAEDLRRAIRQGQGEVLRFGSAGLDRVLRWDAARALIEVQSGTPWQALAQTVPALGDCLAAGLLKDSVGDAVASNAAGPDGRPVVELVEAVTLVTADGSLRRASRTRDAELFALAVGGQGIFGPAYSVTLRVDALAQAAVRVRPAETLSLQDCGQATPRATTLLVPPAKLEAFVADARALLEDWRVPIAGVDVLRTLAEQDTVLRWAKQPYAAVTLRLAFSRPLGACVRGTQVCRALIDRALALGGSFPIATTREASRSQLDACYPELRDLLTEKSRRDPEARLCNAWYRHHRRLLDEARVAVRWNAPQAASA